MNRTGHEAATQEREKRILGSFEQMEKAGDPALVLRLGAEVLGNLDVWPGGLKEHVEVLARKWIGRALADRGEFDAAQNTLGQAIEVARGIGISGVDLWNDLAIVHRRQTKWAQAEDAYRALLRVCPDDSDLWSGTIWYDLARVQERQGKLGQACNSYKEAIRRPLTSNQTADAQKRPAIYAAHSWLPFAIEGLVRCSASQAGNADWVAFWVRSRKRKVVLIGLIAAMALGWLCAFARLLGLAVPVKLWGSAFTMPSSTAPPWAFFVFAALPMVLLLAHQLRSVGSSGVELAPDHPTFPPIPEDELARVRIGPRGG